MQLSAVSQREKRGALARASLALPDDTSRWAAGVVVAPEPVTSRMC